MPRIRKPSSELGREDLEAICREGWVEDELVDFKERIPFTTPDDPWLRDPPDLREYGRDQLLRAVIAFANSYGGDLVVGIREASGSKPGKAEALTPIPGAADAARRLSQAANAVIEPAIPGLEVRAVDTSDDGSGVVIFRVPRSRMAPHRLTTTKDCYHRIRDETMPMSMRQIQDLTFSAARGVEAIERRLDSIRESFRQWIEAGPTGGSGKNFALRATCVPADDSLYLQRVHGITDVTPPQRPRTITLSTGPAYYMHCLSSATNWRAALRGSEAVQQIAEHERCRLGVYCDGAVRYEFDFEGLEHLEPNRALLCPEWWFAIVANAIDAADRVRNFSGLLGIDYVLELEIRSTFELPVLRLGDGSLLYRAGHLPAGPTLYPRYIIGDSGSRDELLNLIWTDFWNSAGNGASEEGIASIV